MSRHMFEKPTRVWILPERGELRGDARLLSEGELKDAFAKYSDTGYEPKLDWLYKMMDCATIDMREIPGLGHLWLDDEGFMRGRTVSPVATVLYQSCYVQDAPVVGTCVLVVYPDAEVDDEKTIAKAWEAWQRLCDSYGHDYGGFRD